MSRTMQDAYGDLRVKFDEHTNVIEQLENGSPAQKDLIRECRELLAGVA